MARGQELPTEKYKNNGRINNTLKVHGCWAEIWKSMAANCCPFVVTLYVWWTVQLVSPGGYMWRAKSSVTWQRASWKFIDICASLASSALCFHNRDSFFILQNGLKLFKIGTQQPTGDHIQALQRMLATGAVSKPNIVALMLNIMASLVDCWLTLAQGQTL